MQAAAKTPSSRAQPAYFVGPAVDFALAGGLSIVVFLLLVLFRRPDRTGGIIFAAAQLSWVVNWPHFSATNYRLYRSWENIRQYPLTALFIPWVILAAVVGALWSPHVLAPYFIKLFLIWSPYHFCAQTIGSDPRSTSGGSAFQIKLWERRVLTTHGLQHPLHAARPLGDQALPPCSTTGSTTSISACRAGSSYAGGDSHHRELGRPRPLLRPGGAAGRPRAPLIVLLVPAAAQYIWFAGSWLWPSFIEFVPFFHSLQYLLIAWSLQLKEKRDRHEIIPSRRFVIGESARWYALNIAGGALLFFFIPQWVSKGTGLPLQFATGVFIAGVQIHHSLRRSESCWKLKRSTVSSPPDGQSLRSSSIRRRESPRPKATREAGRRHHPGPDLARPPRRPRALAGRRPGAGPDPRPPRLRPRRHRRPPAGRHLRPDPERIVLRTIGGDIVIALYPDIAPQTVRQMLTLVKDGVYDTTHFFRSEPQGYYLQLADAATNRIIPLTAAQEAAIHPLRAEWGPLRHVRGAVSLVRPAGQPDGALTSFLIIRKDASFYDKAGDTYTIFGRVEQGMDVVDALGDLRHDTGGTLQVRLTASLTAVAATQAALPGLALRGPQPPDWWLYSARTARGHPVPTSGLTGSPPGLPGDPARRDGRLHLRPPAAREPRGHRALPPDGVPVGVHAARSPDADVLDPRLARRGAPRPHAGDHPAPGVFREPERQAPRWRGCAHLQTSFAARRSRVLRPASPASWAGLSSPYQRGRSAPAFVGGAPGIAAPQASAA